ncbi:MAG: OmpA family protein [Flavobacteriales bacterium]|nr:OmpA family protein [Flavobacteriales bacterium]
MQLKKYIVFTLVFAFTGTLTWSQCNSPITAKADYAYTTNSFFQAIELYEKALKKVKKDKGLKFCIQYTVAKCYLKLNDYKKAEAQFKKIMKGEVSEAMAYYQYGMLLKNQGRYEEAKVQFEKYVQKVPDDYKGKEAVTSCENAIKWINDPTCYQVENVKAFNTKSWEFSPIYANKKQTQLYFTSNREKSMGKESPIWGMANEDFWVSNKDKSGKWSTPTGVPILSTTFSEGAGVFDAKYSTLYFTRCFGDKKNGSGCQIYSARRQGPDKWNEPVKLELAPDSFTTGHPALTPDGKYMIFSSNMPGGEGGMDLWIAEYSKKEKTFVNPKNLGPSINSFFEEVYPFVKEDGKLYFSSNRPSGMGGLDIYKCDKKGELQWGKPENMMYPMNSEGDDFGIVFEAGKEAGFLTSNRKGGKGFDDIYAFTIPKATITLSGTVRDKDTKAVIPDATVTFEDSQGNKFETKTDATGYYKKEIPFGAAYDMTASKKDYYNDINRASTMGLDPLKTCKDTTIVADFYLKTQKVDLEFEIQFVFDKAEWFKEYNDTLNKIIVILKDNPTMVAELGAHTDARGNDKYNEDLAQRRANAVVKYLVDNGIDPKRLQAKGYGESQPRTLQRDMKGAESGYIFPKGTVLTEEYINSLKKEENGEKKFEDAHRLNRRVTVKKISDDYKPPVKKEEKEDGE